MTGLTMIIKLLSHFLGLVSQHTKWALVGLVEPQGPFNRLSFLFHQVCPVFHALFGIVVQASRHLKFFVSPLRVQTVEHP